MPATLRLTFADDALAIETFALRLTSPTTASALGRLMSGEEPSLPLQGGAWALTFELGPLTRPDAAVLRRRVGERLTARVDDPERPAAEWPTTEHWVNADLDAALTDVRVLKLADDAALGSRYEIELTFGGSYAAGAAHPPVPAPVYDPAVVDYWQGSPFNLEPPDSPPGPLGAPFAALSAPGLQGPYAPGAFGVPLFAAEFVIPCPHDPDLPSLGGVHARRRGM